MKSSTTLLLLLFALLITACSGRGDGSLSPDAPAEAVPLLAGGYVVNGFDPLGTEYSGVLTIFSTDVPGEYTLQWIIVGSIQEGRGSLEGNKLQVDWYSLANFDDKVHGTAIYTVTVNGELYGTRTVDGHSGVGTETAYPNN